MSGDDQGPATAEEAARIAGRAVGYRGSYARYAETDTPTQTQPQQSDRPGFPAGYVGGELMPDGSIRGGHPSEETMARARADAGVSVSIVNGRRIFSGENADQFAAMDAGYQYDVEARPGYTKPENLGDSQTQEIFQQRTNPSMQQEQRYALIGQILEQQRQGAYKTPTLTDDRFFEGELQKWGQNYAERSSAIHALQKGTGISGRNELEYAGDLSIEFLKGQPGKKSEWFSPVSGEMSRVLPGGKGLQQYSWDRAVATARGINQPERADFMPAVEKLGSARGSLFAPTVDRTPLNSPTDSIGGRKLPEPFISSYSETTQPTGEIDIFGMKATVPGFGFFQQPTTKTRTVGPLREVNTPFAPAFGALGAMGMPTIGNVPIGKPYVKDGVTMQDYETWDLSKTSERTITETTTVGKSGFDTWYENTESKASKAMGFDKLSTPTTEQLKAGSPLFTAFGLAPVSVALHTPVVSDYMSEYLKGEAEGLRNKPLTTIGFTGVGIVTAGLFRGADKLYWGVARPAIASNVISKGGKWRQFAQGSDFVVNNAPKVLATLYGADVAGRSTAWGTDFSPKAAGRFGTIISTETRPMLAGGVIGYNAPEIGGFAYRSAVKTPGKVSEAIFSTRQRMAGIERIPHGTSGYDFTISPGTSTAGTRGGGPAYSVAYDRLMPPRQTYGGGFSGETQFTPKPQNWEGMGKSQQMSWMKSNYREWIDVGGKKVYTMDFTRPAGRNPVFANDEAMATFGGTKRFTPQPQRAMEPEVSPKPQSKTKYAEPLNINIKTAQEFGSNLPATYQRPGAPAGNTKTALSTNFADRLSNPSSYLEFERMASVQQERQMVGMGVSPYFRPTTGSTTTFLTTPRPSTRTVPYAVPWGETAIAPKSKDDRRRDILVNPMPRGIQSPFSKTSSLTRTTPQPTTTPKPFTEPRPQPQPKREPFAEPTRTPTKTPGVLIPFVPGGSGGSGGKPFGARGVTPWSRRNLVGVELFMNKKKRNKKFPF